MAKSAKKILEIMAYKYHNKNFDINLNSFLEPEVIFRLLDVGEREGDLAGLDHGTLRTLVFYLLLDSQDDPLLRICFDQFAAELAAVSWRF